MTTPALLHTAFFKFVALPHPETMALRLRELTQELLGSILVAHEGINAVLAGPAPAVHRFEQQLGTEPDLQPFFDNITFKHSACKTPPFAKMKVHCKPQVVAVGLPEPSTSVGDGAACVQVDPATLLSPQAWRELLQQDDVVVLDNRNSFEYRLGRFRQAVDPQVRHFRDFPAYVLAHAQEWKDQGKRVAMYCTGGIRCEKTSGWMQGLGLEVLQLEGGILHYFQSLPDAEQDWQGECFVFDNRIALNTRLEETATSLEQVYASEPDGEWRLQRARRLQQAVADNDSSLPP